MASTTLAAGLSEWERAELIRERRSAVDRELEGKQMREMAEIDRQCSELVETTATEIGERLDARRQYWYQQHRQDLINAKKQFLARRGIVVEMPEMEEEMTRRALAEVEKILSQAHDQWWIKQSSVESRLNLIAHLEACIKDVASIIHHQQQQERSSKELMTDKCIVQIPLGSTRAGQLTIQPTDDDDAVKLRQHWHDRRMAQMKVEAEARTRAGIEELAAEKLKLSKKVSAMVSQVGDRASTNNTSKWATKVLKESFEAARLHRQELLKHTSEVEQSLTCRSGVSSRRLRNTSLSADPVNGTAPYSGNVLGGRGSATYINQSLDLKNELIFPDANATAEALVSNILANNRGSAALKGLLEQQASQRGKCIIKSLLSSVPEIYRYSRSEEVVTSRDFVAELTSSLHHLSSVLPDHNDGNESALQKMVACVEAMGQALELLAKVDEKLTTRIIDGIFAAYDHLDDLSGTLECLIDDELAVRAEAYELQLEITAIKEEGSGGGDVITPETRKRLYQLERRLQSCRRDLRTKSRQGTDCQYRQL